MSATSEKVNYVGGLCLGQAQQFSALAALERTAVTVWGLPRPAHYAVRHLERWPPGTPYAELFARVAAAFARAPLAGGTLVVDRTGVGEPVVALLHQAAPRACVSELAVVAGQRATPDAGGWLVPRKELVGVMQVLLQSGRLRVAPALPDAPLLVRELVNFKARVTAVGEAAETWREGEHDDLVLAVACAAWGAECRPVAGPLW